MPPTVITAERLGKKYILGHREVRGHYVALRDVLAYRTKALVRAAVRPFVRGEKRAADPRSEIFWALKDVGFEIQEGDRVGIIGNNGAGKSTLLKILSRITEPTEGRITLRGRVASLLEVGTGFHPELTGRENVFLNGAILGMTKSEIRRKFDEIVAFAEVEKFLDTPVKRYSSGMYVRLAFAVAAHLEPEILIVDEVLAVGDAAFQKKCLGKMEEVGSSGRTVLFVSHNMNAIEQLCTSCLYLKSGRVVTHGTDVGGIIRQYLFGQTRVERSSEWVNADNQFDNPWFTPLRFSLCHADGSPRINPVKNDADIYLQIEGVVREPHEALALEYTVFSDDGMLLFHSSSIDQAENPFASLRPGHRIIRTKIPRRLLNEGEYRIDLTVFLHNIRFITQYGLNTPSVLLAIHGGLTDSSLWSAKRAGYFAPMLQWDLLP